MLTNIGTFIRLCSAHIVLYQNDNKTTKRCKVYFDLSAAQSGYQDQGTLL